MIEFLYLVLKYVLVLLISVITLYIASKLMDKLTANIDEWKEIAQGNVAVSIYFAAVVLSFGILLSASMKGYMSPVIAPDIGTYALALAGDILRALVGMISSVVTIYVALTVYDRLTKDIDEFEELKEGNLAIGIIVAGMILALTLIIAPAVEALSHYIYLKLFGG
ncbi:MAG: DUF350 domain-containing protein [Candidatus Micrarchaeota archaeon]|nr:DUF350 domain-containing protein [Candidatus Micrarchaeota archaeon]